MYLLYEVFLYLVLLIALPWFLLTGVLRGKYLVNFPARAGWFRHRREAHDLWIHAVSVGEAMAAKPVVDEILRQRPGTSIVFTTTTLTGQAQARRLYPEATVTYFPFDFAFAVRRFLEHHRPQVFATMETEIWPNVTRIARERGLRLLLANGRISDRSFPRYRAFRWIVGHVLRKYDRILAREGTDRDRFLIMGAPPAIVEVSGNVKFDYEPDDTPLEIAPQLEALIAGRKVVVFGSTMEGEDEMLLPEIEDLLAHHRVLVVIAPRKPERFELVAALLATSSLRFVRRSEMTGAAASVSSNERPGALPVLPGPSPSVTQAPPDVLLLDTFGELARIYRYATAAFVGGTLVEVGGHNPIEAAAAGVPVAFGPSMSNFREIAQLFLRNQAGAEVRSAAGAVEFAARMLEEPELQRAWGERARKTVLQNRGASKHTARRIVELLA
ncbi:MAG: 3-deoxy-D-manno-octulosonic acid transferase [Acidobacteriota bacterium]